MVADRFFSPALAEMRAVYVYLPEAYTPADTTRRYPVIYFLHGAGGDGFDLAFFTFLARVNLDIILSAGVIEPAIFVFPDGWAPPYQGSFYTNSPLYGNFEDYIVADLIAYVDGKYNTVAERDARLLMGHSMGGYGAMKLALKHPELFRAVAAHSGPLDFAQLRSDVVDDVVSENGAAPPYSYSPDAGTFSGLAFSMAGAFSPNLDRPPYYVDFPIDNRGAVIDSVYRKWLTHSPVEFARRLLPTSGLAIYFDCGTEDELQLFPSNLAFADSLRRFGIAHEFQSYSGDHTNKLIDRVRVSLAFFDSVMATTPVAVTDNPPVVPQSIVLKQNYPNPFPQSGSAFADNPASTIEFVLPRAEGISLTIYNERGQAVHSLVSATLQAGRHQYVWRADGFASGVYYLQLRAGSEVQTKRMVLLR